MQSKGLTILEDQLSHEFLAFKKAESHAAHFTDTRLKDFARQVAQQHLTRYNRLFDYLNSHA